MTVARPLAIVVTGSNGFVGSHVCQWLSSRGHRVTAIVRRDDPRRPHNVAHEIRITSFSDALTLQTAFAGADAVVHAAGRAHVTRVSGNDPLADFRRENVEGTRLVSRSAARAGVRTFAQVSSVAVATGIRARVITEFVTCPPRTPYGLSKLEAEVAAEEEMKKIGGRAVAIRPPLIYGPGMRGAPLDLFRMLRYCVPVPLRGLRAHRSVAFVDNVAAAIGFLLENASADGPYLVADTEIPTVESFAMDVAEALNRTGFIVPLPSVLLRAAARLGDLLAYAIPVPVTSDRLDRILGELILDTSRIRSIGFRPPVAQAVAIRRTADWILRRDTSE